ncbi:MAG: tRNA-guanine transglycosylase DpdA [Gemmatimonadota bacterium]
MKFFFPDSQDFVDPSFDLVTEERSPTRVRQRDDLYPHEIFATPPYDGLLVSMAIVSGYGVGTGKYSIAQRQRFLRCGVREFFRLQASPRLETFGDCGAFSYWKETHPPFTAAEVFEFYESAGFDYGLSVDHVIPVFRPDFDSVIPLPDLGSEVEKWKRRQEITIEAAGEFLRLCHSDRPRFQPVGVAQGWSPRSIAHSVSELQKMGYRTVGIGGLVPLKTPEILDVLKAVSKVRHKDTKLHLLGVTRLDVIRDFARLGATSFDSTAPLMRAFKDKDKNYYLGDRTFPAIRVPQVDGNPKLKRRVLAGEVRSDSARRLEQRVLALLNDFDRDAAPVTDTLAAVLEYEALFDPNSDREAQYRQVLMERPWKRCDCEICEALGIHVILFRGAERNRRRGFHNLHQFYRSLADAVAPLTPKTVRMRRAK